MHQGVFPCVVEKERKKERNLTQFYQKKQTPKQQIQNVSSDKIYPIIPRSTDNNQESRVERVYVLKTTYFLRQDDFLCMWLRKGKDSPLDNVNGKQTSNECTVKRVLFVYSST